MLINKADEVAKGEPKLHVSLPDTRLEALADRTLRLSFSCRATSNWFLFEQACFRWVAIHDDPDATADEKPQHRVTLPDYYLGTTPVTNRQYGEFVKKAGHAPPNHWSGGEAALRHRGSSGRAGILS